MGHKETEPDECSGCLVYISPHQRPRSTKANAKDKNFHPRGDGNLKLPDISELGS